MTEDIQALLSELSAAVDDRALEQAADIASDLRELYENRRDTERREVERGRTLYEGDGSITGRDATTVTGLSRVDGSARFARATTLTMVSIAAETETELAEADELEPLIDRIQASLSELQSAETDRSARSEESQQITDGQILPSRLSLTQRLSTAQPISPGETVEILVGIDNVGDESAEGVRLRAESSEGIRVNTEEVSIGTVGDVRIDESIEVVGNEEGTHTIRITAESESGQPTESTRGLTVRGDGVEEDGSQSDSDTRDDDPIEGDEELFGYSLRTIVGGGAVTAGLAYLMVRMVNSNRQDKQ